MAAVCPSTGEMLSVRPPQTNIDDFTVVLHVRNCRNFGNLYLVVSEMK